MAAAARALHTPVPSETGVVRGKHRLLLLQLQLQHLDVVLSLQQSQGFLARNPIPIIRPAGDYGEFTS
ncbi:hypothetical protein EMIHUDRAFT_257569 [Emiliania huxleyi CCMP1516]|uniref:Uncharacterized protein n=2 Tax=Emiliania huxleyi TaxID=2903 RepID=A0A0D3IIA2_EMIH1|nr:hypothetical protein EMIHUDRAFT_257569 [Emiliania huxleyi CCMP1516]EOD10987.1 hypothetical protein EMIHUDRAFT_257569 [Emiliania huxleyi CCMP1516]|eukprot:XP_005763416.1 hypothetical protein EMIHUDRAFT_257569 [Emiliania huxleyi CCMP1516]